MDIFSILCKLTKLKKLQKTEQYKEMEKQKAIFNQYGFLVANDYLDLYYSEVVFKGITCYEMMSDAYALFNYQNQDILNHVNYDERRKMLQFDIGEKMIECQKFNDKNTGIDIYVPYLEGFINQRIVNDYEMLTLKQHQTYIKKYIKSYPNIRSLYQLQPLISELSSLVYIDAFSNKAFFYDAINQYIVVINEETYEFRIVPMCHVKSKNADFSSIEAAEVVALYKLGKHHEIVDLIYKYEMVTEKQIKKINKDLGR